jgi:hypothetical protein
MQNAKLPAPGPKLRTFRESGLTNPRLLVLCALCLCGVLLGVFSLAATPLAKRTRPNTGRRYDSADFRSAGSANQSLPVAPLPATTPNHFALPQVTAEAHPRIAETAACIEEQLLETSSNSY